MQHLTATQDFPYAGKSLKSGDPFDASDEDARILKVLGKAKDVSVAPRPAPVETRAVAADEGDGLFAPPSEGQSKRKRYNRRDMRAEG